MTEEECEHINRAVAHNCAESEAERQREAKRLRAKYQAQQKQRHAAIRAGQLWGIMMMLLAALVRFEYVPLLAMDIVMYPVTAAVFYLLGCSGRKR